MLMAIILPCNDCPYIMNISCLVSFHLLARLFYLSFQISTVQAHKSSMICSGNIAGSWDLTQVCPALRPRLHRDSTVKSELSEHEGFAYQRSRLSRASHHTWGSRMALPRKR